MTESKIRLEPIGSNQTVLCLGEKIQILFSYSTAVAGYDGTGNVPCYIVANVDSKGDPWSPTTKRHIKNYLGEGKPCLTVPQRSIEALLHPDNQHWEESFNPKAHAKKWRLKDWDDSKVVKGAPLPWFRLDH